VRSQRRANLEERMPLFDYLRKLRNRVVNMALVLAAGCKSSASSDERRSHLRW
jgi:hypothetical protein